MKPLEVTSLNFGKRWDEAMVDPAIMALRKRLKSGRIILLYDDQQAFDGFAIEDPATKTAFTGDVVLGIRDLAKWFYHPAKWYQFWLPQSGVSGGFVFTLVVAVVAAVIFTSL